MDLWFPGTTRPTRGAGTVLEAYGHSDGGEARFVEWDGHTLFIAGAARGTLGINVRGPREMIAAYPVIGEALDGSLHNLYLGGPTNPDACTSAHTVEAIPSLGANICGEPHDGRHSVTYRYAGDKLVIGTGVDIVRIRVYERLQTGQGAVTSWDDYRPDITYGEAVLMMSVEIIDPDGVRELMIDSGAHVKLKLTRG